ncbi:MAG: EamA family transporter [Coriobacteriia bacterium]|nr:EamA family transporter [Coriobacteriia bacterium]
MNRNEWQGNICAFAGATLWGLSGVCSDFLLSDYGMSALLLTMVRMVAAAVLFGMVLAVRHGQRVAAMLRDAWTVRQVLLFGCLGLFACQATYILSIGATNAGTATVMQSLNIVFCPMVGWFLGRGRLSWQEAVGVFLAFASVVCIATQGDITSLSMPVMGLVWGLLNGASETFYVMQPKALFEKWGSFAGTGLGMIAGAVVAVLVWAVAGAVDGGLAAGAWAPQLDAAGWVALAVVAVIGTFVSFALFLRGVHLVGPVRSSLLGAMEPISAAVLSALWLGTAFTGWDWLGLCLMLVVIAVVTLGGAKR